MAQDNDANTKLINAAKRYGFVKGFVFGSLFGAIVFGLVIIALR